MDWLRHALAETEALPTASGELVLELTRSGRNVVVRGQARVQVTMPCSRTLDPVVLALAPEIFLMLSQELEPEAPRGRRAGRGRRAERPAKGPRRKGSGGAREPRGGWAADPTLSDDEAARDTFLGEQIVLDPFVREFLLLELPMFPLRSDLPSDAPAAIAPASSEEPADSARPEGAKPRSIDPRLAPLAEIASRLQSDKE